MKIVLFIDSLHNGGAQRQMSIMADLFAKYGHEVTVASFESVKDDYAISNMVHRVRIGNNCGKIKRWLKVLSFFRNERYDLVISFIANEMAVISTFYLFNRKNFVMIAGERTFSETAAKIKKLKKRLKYYRFVDYVVSNSHSQTELFAKIKPKWKHKFLTIGNYVDVNSFSVTPLPGDRIKKIGIFARYHSDKNGRRLIEAIRLNKEYGISGYHVFWYGHIQDHNNDTIHDEWNRLIQQYGLEEQITLCDRVYDVNSCIQKLDSVCLPSITEGFANAIAEGICCGRPILASNISDNPLMVEDGVNGFLFNPLDINDIAGKLKAFVFLDNAKIQEMGNMSRKKAIELFDEEVFVKKYLSLADKRLLSNL